MAYLGNTPTQQGFIPAIDYFSGNASTVAFTLSRPVASVAQVQAVIENVPQNPGDAFTVSGNTITFTSAPPSGTNNIYVYYTSPITQVVALPQSPQVFGNLQFSSPGARITGDFSGSPTANRVFFETSTANTSTTLGIKPNGTGTNANFGSYSNDLTNGSALFMGVTNGATEARLNSTISGTGSYLPMTFYTGGSETARFSATAKTLILAGGSTSSTGTGITFPASQSASSDANTLDDYEEGTFSPTIIGGSVAGTATYSRQNGIYTKIGNRVFFTIQIEWSAGNGSGALIIAGLPFTQSGGGSDTPYSASEWSNVAWDANYTPTPVGPHNTTNIFINASRVGASGTSINTTYDAAGYFSMTGHYRIA